MDKIFFATRLSNLRESKDISAREMSLALGQSESYINKIENGKSLPSMQIFFYICEYLEITPKDFFDDNITFPTEVNDLIKSINKLNKEQFDNLIFIVNQFNS